MKKQNMTEKDLGKIRMLQAEIQSLTIAIQKLGKTRVVSDYYKDYSTGYPKVKTMTGLGMDDTNAKLIKRLEAKRQVLHEQLEQAEDWIEQITNGEMRTIIRLYYCCGLTQEEIAEAIGIKNQETISRKIHKFWGR